MSVRVRKRCVPWLVIAVVALVGACGQRGDLYLPDAPPSAEVIPVEEPTRP